MVQSLLLMPPRSPSWQAATCSLEKLLADRFSELGLEACLQVEFGTTPRTIVGYRMNQEISRRTLHEP